MTTSEQLPGPLPPGEAARFARVTSLPGVEVLGARFLKHRFAPHTHDTWAIGAVLNGAQDNAARDGIHQIVASGELTAIPPGEPHAGRLAGTAECEYAMIYVPDRLLRDDTREMGAVHLNLKVDALADDGLARRLASFVRLALNSGASDLLVQGEWVSLIDALTKRYGEAKVGPFERMTGGGGVNRARAFLEDHWSQAVTLEDLAREAQMSPTYFCRQFSRTHGLSPHRYQVVLRVNRAKDLLACGARIADVAALTGFSDQSHLGRHLKSCLGVTPGEIASTSSRARTFYP